MELTNKRVSYSVTNENDAMKVSGEVSINANNEISNFNGQLMDKESVNVGNFYYSEMNDKINKNINNIDEAHEELACAIIKETVNAIKLEINK